MTVIAIRPVQAGWSVSVPGVENPLMFRNGGHAETSARRLAVQLGEAGRAVQIQLFLDDGALAARLVYAANTTPPRVSGATSQVRSQQAA